ncbi:MAG: glutathione S-transferase family protein [Acetobacteraceae bacterium]
MKLFYAAGSPYARLIRIALLELGLDAGVEKQEVTLRDPHSALLPYNPVGRVPTLQLDNGTVLTESLLILSYLDAQHGGQPLLPRDGSDDWVTMARLGTAWGMMDGIAVWNRELRRPENERSPSMIAVDTARTHRTMDALETAVADGAYCGRMDAARIALGCTLSWTERRHRSFPWREGRPVLSAWYDEIAKTPSFEATLPPIV